MIKIHNSESFCKEIERLYKHHRGELTYLDVIMMYIKVNVMDHQTAAKLVNNNLKAKMKAECHTLNLLGKKPKALSFTNGKEEDI